VKIVSGYVIEMTMCRKYKLWMKFGINIRVEFSVADSEWVNDSDVL
jgi:hypothetical protein